MKPLLLFIYRYNALYYMRYLQDDNIIVYIQIKRVDGN